MCLNVTHAQRILSPKNQIYSWNEDNICYAKSPAGIFNNDERKSIPVYWPLRFSNTYNTNTILLQLRQRKSNLEMNPYLMSNLSFIEHWFVCCVGGWLFNVLIPFVDYHQCSLTRTECDTCVYSKTFLVPPPIISTKTKLFKSFVLTVKSLRQ